MHRESRLQSRRPSITFVKRKGDLIPGRPAAPTPEAFCSSNERRRVQSVREFRQIFVLAERFRIGERLEVLHGTAVDDLSHRQFYDLSGLGPRNV